MNKIVLAIALCGSLSTVAMARPSDMHYSYEGDYQVTPSGIVIPPDYYLGPDGSYNATGDFTHAVNGTACDKDCTRRAYERWNPGNPALPAWLARHGLARGGLAPTQTEFDVE